MNTGRTGSRAALLRSILGFLAWLCAVALSGCAATHADRLREVSADFQAGNVDVAVTKLDDFAKRYPREANCFKLDRAIVELSAGRPRVAEQILREVRDSLDYYEQKNLAESAGSMLSDDTITAYAGEDYEKILVRAFLALASLMDGGDDARAYSLQVADLQERIIQAGTDESGMNPKLAYGRVALGAYIEGVLREERPMEASEAARSWIKVCNWEPSFPYGHVDVERAIHGRHSQRGNGVLYVFTLVGRGPCKLPKEETAATIGMLVGDRIVSYTGKHTLPPTLAAIKVPKVMLGYNTTNGVQVWADGQPAGGTATITDVGQLAVQQGDAIYPQVLGRAVARRIAKKGVAYGVKEAAQISNNSILNFVTDVAGVAWEATEEADCRCWGLLPNQIQVLRLELPAGEHRIGLSPVGRHGMLAAQESAVHIADGRNTYLLANFVDGKLLGKLSTSEK